MPLITISRSIGCGGTAIARCVAEGLKVELYDDRRLQEEAVQLGIRQEDLRGLDEKAPALFDRVLSHRPEFYVDLLQGVVYEVARRGQGVILGHGSQILLRDFQCALHVHIHASESFRIAHLMAQQGLSREPAAKLIHRSDSERKGFLRFAFHMDWNDPSLYDIIINRDKLGTDLAATLIMEAAQSQEIKDCSLTALETMERLALSRRVQAAILKSDFSTNVFHIDVLERGIVHITGFTHDRGEISHLLETVKGVPGVSEVRSEIAFVPLAAE